MQWPALVKLCSMTKLAPTGRRRGETPRRARPSSAATPGGGIRWKRWRSLSCRRTQIQPSLSPVAGHGRLIRNCIVIRPSRAGHMRVFFVTHSILTAKLLFSFFIYYIFLHIFMFNFLRPTHDCYVNFTYLVLHKEQSEQHFMYKKYIN